MIEDIRIPEEIKNHPAWHRLASQTNWYSKKSSFNKTWYMATKIVQIVIAGSIPLISLIDVTFSKYIVAVFGALIATVEAIQQLFQFQVSWTEYRSTNENLKHEKFLFLSLSGPYRELSLEQALLLLAERTEEHISKEHAKWIDSSKNISPGVVRPPKEPSV